jgi:hypothetical protein
MKFLTFSIFGDHFCPPGSGSSGLIESDALYPRFIALFILLVIKHEFLFAEELPEREPAPPLVESDDDDDDEGTLTTGIK